MWLLRVSSELLPLQEDGSAGLSPDDVRWHSRVVVEKPPPRPRIRLYWRTRKNAPAGDSAVRSCTCGPDPVDCLLCGPCALLGQLAETASRRSAAAPIFPRLQGRAARTAFVAVATALGEPAAWHAFRRGMARDMLDRGDSLAEILLAGAWRSGAFMRYLMRTDLDRRVAFEYATAGSEDDA